MKEDYIPEGNPTATFWYQATPGTTYARCRIPAKALGAQSLGLTDKDVQERKDFLGEGTGEPYFPRQKGPAVWQFPGNRTRFLIMREMVKQDIPVFTETDDNYTAHHVGQPGLVTQWKAKAPPDKPEQTNRETHWQACRLSDGIIVSTDYLANKYEKLNRNIYVCPNSIDPDDWPKVKKRDDGILRIGYAYSSSHWYDLELIFDALEWASKQKNVEVIMQGPILPMAGFNRMKFVHFPWVDSLEEYRKNLSLIDVGLCPIRAGDWANGRSDLKALEYTMAGAVPLMSPTVSYEPWFGMDQFFPDKRNRSKDWLRLVKEIVSGWQSDLAFLQPFLQTAKKYVQKERYIEKTAHYWQEALEG